MTHFRTCIKLLHVTILGIMAKNGRIGLCDSLLSSIYYLKRYSHTELVLVGPTCMMHLSCIINIFRLLGLTPYTTLHINILLFLYIRLGRISLSVSESPIILSAGNLCIFLFFTHSCRILIS